MLEGVGTLTNLSQDNQHAVQGQTEGPHEKTPDVVEGKVNPTESLDNLSDESNPNEETRTQDKLNRGPGEERIIDLLG